MKKEIILARGILNSKKGKTIKVNKNKDLIFFLYSLGIVGCFYELDQFKPEQVKLDLELPSNDSVEEMIPYEENKLLILTKFALLYFIEFANDTLILKRSKQDLKLSDNYISSHSLFISKITAADLSEDNKYLAISNFNGGINRVIIFEFNETNKLRFCYQESSEPDFNNQGII